MSKRRQHQHQHADDHDGDHGGAAEAEPAAPSLSALAGLGAHEPAPSETAPDPTAPTPEPWASGGTAHDPGDEHGDEHGQESAADAAAVLAEKIEAARRRGAAGPFDRVSVLRMPLAELTIEEVEAELAALPDPAGDLDRLKAEHEAVMAERLRVEQELGNRLHLARLALERHGRRVDWINERRRVLTARREALADGAEVDRQRADAQADRSAGRAAAAARRG